MGGERTRRPTGIRVLVVLGFVQRVLLIALAVLMMTASSVYASVALHDVRLAGLWTLATSVLVLWFLYGSDQVQEYFAP